jgi:hypothetical protein
MTPRSKRVWYYNIKVYCVRIQLEEVDRFDVRHYRGKIETFLVTVFNLKIYRKTLLWVDEMETF